MFPWLLAFSCESWFTLYWGIIVNCKWNPVDFKTYPENVDKRFPDLPNVDMFVTTADPVLEPPIITVNTILSLLAVDYPAEKLACYVSDDGCSPLTFYSVVEASKFAKLWVPFCKKYNIQVRAPFRYFLGDSDQPSNANYKANSEFQQDWLKMKAEYEVLTRKIEEAARKPIPCDLTGEFADFSDVERRNHSTIVKIILEHKEINSDHVVPDLVYVSREKRPKQPHNYKAGAMNVLGRVSGVMTNAPFMLNVDCDMFVNNPQVVRHAMCQLLGCPSEEIAFVQYPQVFYGSPRDDPYGNQFVAVFHYIGRGITGTQGYFYAGTGCFHRRKVIYGLWPDDVDEAPKHTSINGKLVDETALRKEFGNCEEFINSAAQALKGKQGAFPKNLSNSLEAACEVASCNYEHGTSWGTKLGWIYGSTAEDLHTGLVIHNKGWNSTLHALEPPAFMGCAPSGGPEAMTQQKRWATGLSEILIGKNSPIFSTMTTNLQFRMRLAYLWILLWGLRSVPELLYATLPAYCILTNSRFLPKVEEGAIWIPIAIFVTYNLHNLREYLKIGLSVRAWWNNMRMGRIAATSAFLLGLFSVILKLLGISETVFEVTQKDQSSDGDDNNPTKFTFNKSALFVPGTTLVLLHLISLLALPLRLQSPFRGVQGVGLGELFCSLWVMLCFRPFLTGLFEKGKYGIPSSTIFKSAALATLFIHFCRS
ncbi:Cellulose synthase [Corchorus capsularis]|uniref:Cellulose synthase n=1 Tax=Corchorus capsularis TaxID=210143 RepID=A0A1R3JD54_COCAP|nr:Cellulose synthase [Corchorus capsularis]